MKEYNPFIYKTVHFIGVAGSGMIALAQYLRSLGRCKVTGSDLRKTPALAELEKQGIKVFTGHKKEHVKNADIVVYSSAIKPDNIERKSTKKRKLAQFSRGNCLSQFMAPYQRRIVVAGTHGKTSTTGMLIHVFDAAGVIPSFMIGGEMAAYGCNGRFSESSTFVTESDESDGSFLELSPTAAIITNLEAEHLDYYKTKENLLNAFDTFSMNTHKNNGTLFYNKDNADLATLCDNKAHTISFGINAKDATYTAKNIQFNYENLSFTTYKNGKKQGRITLNAMGQHNVYNALSTVALGIESGLPFSAIQKGLKAFQGIKRRMQLISNNNDIDIYDDYAHHPTEIQTTLTGLKQATNKNITCIFQPHRYSRVSSQKTLFHTIFGDVHRLLIAPIYAANEPEPEQTNNSPPLINTIIDGIKAHASCDIHYFEDPKKILSFLKENIQAGEIVITMGAGDINQISASLASYYKEEALSNT